MTDEENSNLTYAWLETVSVLDLGGYMGWTKLYTEMDIGCTIFSGVVFFY